MKGEKKRVALIQTEGTGPSSEWRRSLNGRGGKGVTMVLVEESIWASWGPQSPCESCLCPAGWTHIADVLAMSWVCSVVPFLAGMRLPGLMWWTLPSLPYRWWQDSFSHMADFIMKLRFVNSKPKLLTFRLCPPPSHAQHFDLSPCCSSLLVVNTVHPSRPFSNVTASQKPSLIHQPSTLCAFVLFWPPGTCICLSNCAYYIL